MTVAFTLAGRKFVALNGYPATPRASVPAWADVSVWVTPTRASRPAPIRAIGTSPTATEPR